MGDSFHIYRFFFIEKTLFCHAIHTLRLQHLLIVFVNICSNRSLIISKYFSLKYNVFFHIQCSFSIVFLIITMEAGRHRRRFQSTNGPYYAVIKLDRTCRWITMIVFSKQLSFQLHFLKPW